MPLYGFIKDDTHENEIFFFSKKKNFKIQHNFFKYDFLSFKLLTHKDHSTFIFHAKY